MNECTLDGLFSRILSPAETDFSTLVFKLTLSLLLGGLIGIERKRKGQLAGIRTFALICMGSTLAMIVSVAIPRLFSEVSDPSRIAGQVITGIGFLGAGAIIQTRGSIRGLTTASGIWVVAALGLAIGLGLYAVAVVSTCLILFALVTLERYEHRLSIERTAKIIRITLGTLSPDLKAMQTSLLENRVTVHDQFLDYDYTHHTSVVEYVVLLPGKTSYPDLFETLRKTEPAITAITLRNELK